MRTLSLTQDECWHINDVIQITPNLRQFIPGVGAESVGHRGQGAGEGPAARPCITRSTWTPLRLPCQSSPGKGAIVSAGRAVPSKAKRTWLYIAPVSAATIGIRELGTAAGGARRPIGEHLLLSSRPYLALLRYLLTVFSGYIRFKEHLY